MAFSHRFDPTTLREYDIRGTVGRTLFEDDAFAIGRCFGSIVARQGGITVAVGYDGRLSSPQLETALVKGLSASGIEAVRIGRGPTPMLYYASTTLKTDGAVMVTGSHNPPDYNGFKMVLGGKPFFGEQIRALGGQALAGDVVEETVAPERNVDVSADYVARLLADWDGGDRVLKVVWDNGNGAAGEVLQRLVAGLPGEHVVLNGTIDGTLPGASSRSDGAGEPAAADRRGGGAACRYRHRAGWRRGPDRPDRRHGTNPVRRSAAGAAGARRAARSIRVRRSLPM